MVLHPMNHAIFQPVSKMLEIAILKIAKMDLDKITTGPQRYRLYRNARILD